MGMLSLLAGFSLAFLSLSGAPDVSQLSEPAAPIRVISNTHEVHFPDKVVFRLKAEADEPITQVRLFYKVARRDVKVYGYPQFTPATNISTDYTLKTNGNNYLPSGVDIEYYYEISDAKGNTIESDRNLLGYRDPSYRWQELRDGAVVLLWHDRDYDRVGDAAAELNRRIEPAKEMFGLETTPPIKAVILNSRLEAQRSFPRVSAAATRGHLYGGFAQPEYDLFVLSGLGVDGMVHETVHLLLDESVSSARARVPAWLNEGLAQYFESMSHRRQTTAERAARTGQLLRLRNMNTQPGRPSEVRIFYAQSWSVVNYLIGAYGADRMTALLSTLNSGKRINDAVLEVYGMSLDEVDRRWKAGLMGETTIAARPDPGTIATSTLITGAATVALVVTFMRWLLKWLGEPVSKDPSS